MKKVKFFFILLVAGLMIIPWFNLPDVHLLFLCGLMLMAIFRSNLPHGGIDILARAAAC